ncbi:hypothetical protein Xen7305DRAFT_00005540 [Xenococcus sp. PCC 7305]|uniref:CHAT domain-containing protein n=1 Tax=Xenococcus sp. PCC 7305 TaxID=102125 RepID=UPI0002ACFD8B|nr:CHAT domain-containing protein [Xenococcus sp. PCC 7305]ELS00853.1 hypothetical protein Xen7305DRAFT_00005540 [Xenococcus sp. PCC 7305]
MFRFLDKLWKWIKGWFGQNKAPEVNAYESTILKPGLSDLEYENLLAELLEEVVQGRNWGQIQGFLFGNNLEPEKLASWLRSFGQRWLLQPESHQELGHRLLVLSKIARDELREVARELGENLVSAITENEKRQHSETINNYEFITPSQPGLQPPLNLVGTVKEQNSAELQNYGYFYDQGVELRRVGKNEEALAFFYQALNHDPDTDFGLFLLFCGRTLNDLGRTEEALAFFDLLLKTHPSFWVAWFERGRTLYDLRRYEESLTSYNQAIKLEFDEYLTWTNRGTVLSKLNKEEEALASYCQALKLKPDDFAIWRSCGGALSKLNRKGEAFIFYEQALKLKPDDYMTCYNYIRHLYLSSCQSSSIPKNFASIFFLEVSQVSQRTILSLEELDLSQTIVKLKTSLYDSQLLLAKAFDNDCSIRIIKRISQDPPEELYNLFQQPISKKLIQFIQQPFSQKSIYSFKQDLFSHSHYFDTLLNIGGYEDAIIRAEEKLDQAIKQETHSLGWGKLHSLLGYIHYLEGREHSRSFDYWHKAVVNYNHALETLTETDYPKEHLEVLQNLIKVQLGFGNSEAAEQLRLKGLEVLKNLLNQTPSFAIKKQLQLKFIDFHQLSVDILIKQEQIIQALTSAELSKNICLDNLLHTWQEQTVCPGYEQIQELLTPETAIIYWHLSPQSLNTFILKANLAEPIILSQPIEQQEPTQLPHSLKRLQKYKTWLAEWNQQYQDYRGKNKKVAEAERRNHSWRTEMFSQLAKLKIILDIPTIESHLADITQLILIPHQDLHRLPLHLLFDSFLTNPESTINYFPSLQIALTLQQKQPHQNQPSLLNIENPANDLPYAAIESVLINSMFTQATHLDTVNNSQLKTELKANHNIFHFTGHGAYNQHQPQNSALTLAQKEQITAQEISQLNLKSYQLISLAACETAITGQETIDTEYVGLVSGFLEAGATAVLSTLWTVEEISSAWLMIRFYQLYLEKKTPALALKKAQAWLRSLTYSELKIWLEELAEEIRATHPNVYAYLQDFIRDIQQKSDRMDTNHRPYDDPYYWAAFTCTGGKLL